MAKTTIADIVFFGLVCFFSIVYMLLNLHFPKLIVNVRILSFSSLTLLYFLIADGVRTRIKESFINSFKGKIISTLLISFLLGVSLIPPLLAYKDFFNFKTLHECVLTVIAFSFFYYCAVWVFYILLVKEWLIEWEKSSPDLLKRE
jgi:hypothetical protein